MKSRNTKALATRPTTPMGWLQGCSRARRKRSDYPVAVRSPMGRCAGNEPPGPTSSSHAHAHTDAAASDTIHQAVATLYGKARVAGLWSTGTTMNRLVLRLTMGAGFRDLTARKVSSARNPPFEEWPAQFHPMEVARLSADGAGGPTGEFPVGLFADTSCRPCCWRSGSQDGGQHRMAVTARGHVVRTPDVALPGGISTPHEHQRYGDGSPPSDRCGARNYHPSGMIWWVGWIN